MIKSVVALLACGFFTVGTAQVFAQNLSSGNSIIIDRKLKQLVIKDGDGRILLTTTVGIGRGELKKKTSMQDCITPTGKFRVDVILTDDPKLCAIDSSVKKTLSRNSLNARAALSSPDALSTIFKTMNAVDFNRDGKSDYAYGYAFIGLDGDQTGPKLVSSGLNGGKVRWYSIAMHGSPNEEKSIGHATSEGCIHIKKSVLKDILARHLVDVGTQVVILDSSDVKL
ncbi:MAG: L,D-transpeptidase [Leptolyngbya sp.]|nr:L,D-transpeptidase [Candidatus Melainabacteria bacterium]